MDARKDVPERLRAVRQLLPQIESLSAGVEDVASWVREGDALLADQVAQLRAGLTAGADGAPSLAAIELLLERHRVRHTPSVCTVYTFCTVLYCTILTSGQSFFGAPSAPDSSVCICCDEHFPFRFLPVHIA